MDVKNLIIANKQQIHKSSKLSQKLLSILEKK